MGRRFTALSGIAILAAFGGWLSYSLPSWMFRVSLPERSRATAPVALAPDRDSGRIATLAAKSSTAARESATASGAAGLDGSEPPSAAPSPSASNAESSAAEAKIADAKPETESSSDSETISPGELLAQVAAAPPPRFDVAPFENVTKEGADKTAEDGDEGAFPVLEDKGLSPSELLAQATALPPAPIQEPEPGVESDPPADALMPPPTESTGDAVASAALAPEPSAPTPMPKAQTPGLADQIADAKRNDSSSETAPADANDVEKTAEPALTAADQSEKTRSRFLPEDFARVDPALLLNGPIGLPKPLPADSASGSGETLAALSPEDMPKRDVSLRPTAAFQDLPSASLPDVEAPAPAAPALSESQPPAQPKPRPEPEAKAALEAAPQPEPQPAPAVAPPANANAAAPPSAEPAPASAPAPVPDPFAESDDAASVPALRPVAAGGMPKLTDPFAESEGTVKSAPKPDPFAETESQGSLFNVNAAKDAKPKAKLVGLGSPARTEPEPEPKPTATRDLILPEPPARPMNDLPPPEPGQPPAASALEPPKTHSVPAPASAPALNPEPESATLPAPEPEPEPEVGTGPAPRVLDEKKDEGVEKTQAKDGAPSPAPASVPAPSNSEQPGSVPIPNPEADADAEKAPPASGAEAVPAPPVDQTKTQPAPAPEKSDKPVADPAPAPASTPAPNPSSSEPPSARPEAEPSAEEPPASPAESGSKPKSGADESPAPYVLPLDRLTLLTQDLGLNVAVQAPDKVNVGKPATLRIIVKNNSATDAQEVLVRGQLPDNVEYVDSRPEVQRIDGQIVTWRLGMVAAKSDRELLIGVIPKSTGSFEFAATIAALGGARARPTAVLEPRLEVKLRTSPERTIQKGRSVKLEIEITNPGTGLARDVRVQVGLTPGLKYQQKSAAEREIVTFDQKFDLPAGQSKTLPQFSVEAVSPGEQSIQVIAKSADVIDSELANRSVMLNVIEPQLKIKLVGPEKRYTDTIAVYDLTVENPGTAPANNVTVFANLTEGGFLVAKGGGQFDEQRRRLSWTLPTVEPGKPVPLKFEVRMSRAANYRVNSEARTEDGLHSSDSWTTEVVGIADLSAFTVEEKHRVLDVGMQTDFEIRVINGGTKEARNVNISAILSSQLKVLSTGGTKEQASHNPSTNEVRFPTIARIEPNGTILLTIRVEATGRGAASCDVAVKHEDLGDVPIRKTAVVPITEDRRKR